MSKTPIIAVLGPTASGKTSLAVDIALCFNAEVLSCDSMQIYRELSVATAKPTESEMRGVPHHLVDFLPPDKPFSVAEYVAMAENTICDIRSRGKNIVLCGGTGLYADALLSGMRFADTEGFEEKRAEIAEFYETYGLDAAVERLGSADAAALQTVDLKNPKRVLRALEIIECTARPLSEYRNANVRAASPSRVLRLVIDFKDRSALYERIDRRVDSMLENGLADEAKKYYAMQNISTASQAIGYKELKPYLDGEKTLSEAADELKRATRRYAKRQQTWFRRNENAVFLYADREDIRSRAFNLCEEFLKGETFLA